MIERHAKQASIVFVLVFSFHRPVFAQSVVEGQATTIGQGTEPASAATAVRPGMWRLGPFYLTPKFRIGSVGLDTNVLYTPTERITDISASGGPGLELVLPLGASGRFYSEGFLDYIYFVRTASQRRLTGSARGGFDFRGVRTSLVLEESWMDTFSRPSFEINQRVEQITEGTRLDFKRRLFGRISLRATGSRSRSETPAGETYLGADLQQTLTRSDYRALGGLDYALSVKTSVVVEAEQQWVRYPFDEFRDADSHVFRGGLRTDATALIGGHALVGKRFYKFKESLREGSATVADVDAAWTVSPKTKLGVGYTQDLAYSALPTVGATEGASPLLTTQTYGARIEKGLMANLDVRLFANWTGIKSDSPVAVIVPGEGLVVRKRDDTYFVVGMDLGYRFRPRLRIGVAATYGEQATTIDYFGVKGLIVGATVRYNP